MGYPALSKFMPAVHHAYCLVKMPGCRDTLTIHFDEKDVRHALAQVYKASAPISLGWEDTPDHDEPAPTKKRQLSSQERALLSPL